VLRVAAAHLEAGPNASRTAIELAAELRIMAGWLGLGDVTVEPRGGLAGELARALEVTAELRSKER
jgi:uncharacterized protein YcaQ